MKYDVHSIEEYLNAIPGDRKPQLERMMTLIRTSAPGIDEVYSHHMPFYTYLGQPVFALASQKHFMALYVADPALLASYGPALGKCRFGKNCIRFTAIENLDLDQAGRLLTEVFDRKKGTVNSKV